MLYRGYYMQSKRLSLFETKLPGDSSLSPSIAKFLGLEGTVKLLSVSKITNTFFKKSVTKVAAQKLALHAVRGEYDQVCAMIKISPSLLLENPGKIIDLSGRTIDSETVYRVILGTEDVQMIVAAKQELVNLASDKIADEQYHAQFPDGWLEEEKKEWSPLFDQLNVLDGAICSATNDDIKFDQYNKLEFLSGKIEKELAKFHALLDATKNRPIKTGRHFNSSFFKAVCDHCDRLNNNWEDPKRKLYWQKVFGMGGGVERLLPACDAQAASDGFYMTSMDLEKGKEQNRSLTVELDPYAFCDYALWDCCRLSSFYALSGVDIGVYAGDPESRLLGLSSYSFKGVLSVEDFMQIKKKLLTETYPKSSSANSLDGF